MSPLPPLVVDVEPRRRACVLDVPLALTPNGLLLALRLSQEINVWLVRSLWRFLDNVELTFDATDFQRRAVAAINQWQAARVQTDLAGLRLYWAADATRTSQLPKDCEANLVSRFEALDESLQADDPSGLDVTDLDEHSREVVALTVALTAHRPVVFALRARSEDGKAQRPYLCRFLESRDIPCRKVGRRRSAVLRDEWSRAFARSGVTELLWAGLDVAAVHIVTPNAVVAGNVAGDDGFPQERLLDPARRAGNPWAGATSYWYPLTGS